LGIAKVCAVSRARADVVLGRHLAISERDLKNASVSAMLLLPPHDVQRFALDLIQVAFVVAYKPEDHFGEAVAPILYDCRVVVARDVVPYFVERLAKHLQSFGISGKCLIEKITRHCLYSVALQSLRSVVTRDLPRIHQVLY
jgi:hypothetical protein